MFTTKQIREFKTVDQLKSAVVWFVSEYKNLQECVPFGTFVALKRTIENKAQDLNVSMSDLNRMIDT